VCGNLKEVVEYAIRSNNSIQYFAEINSKCIEKLPEKELITLLEAIDCKQLIKELVHRKYLNPSQLN
jgi:hypothetical protein